MQQKEKAYSEGAATHGATPAARHRIATAVEIRIINIVEVVETREIGKTVGKKRLICGYQHREKRMGEQMLEQ